MKTLFNVLLGHLHASYGATSQEEMAEYLRSLQGAAKLLWDLYRYPKIVMRHETEGVQSVCLLGYLPFL